MAMPETVSSPRRRSRNDCGICMGSEEHKGETPARRPTSTFGTFLLFFLAATMPMTAVNAWGGGGASASTQTTSTPFTRHAASSVNPTDPSMPQKVLVTGASGKTGRLVLERLLERRPEFFPKALVRSERSARRMLRSVPACPLEDVILADVTSEGFPKDLINQPGLQDLQAMVICTSAVPQLQRRSLLRAAVNLPLRWAVASLYPKKPAAAAASSKSRRPSKPLAAFFRSLRFKWKNGGTPELVDYRGQLAQIELAKALGVQHVVVVSSMGGTDPNNFLNDVGKNPATGEGGDILKFKRRAEVALVESGLSYTIIHPGGLVDEPGGVEKLVLDVDDNLGRRFNRTRISRAGVADLCVAALTVNNSNNDQNERGVSFDCIALPMDGDADEQTNTPEAVLAEFLQEGKTTNYYGRSNKGRKGTGDSRKPKKLQQPRQALQLPQLFQNEKKDTKVHS